MPTENTDSSTIFLTGFPGFIATRLVRRLAGNGSELYLLVQPSLKELAAKESARISAEFGLAPDRIRLFEGDITRPDLGLDEGGAKQIRQHANRAFHLAAIYDLGVEKDLAIKVNVEGTKNVNRFVGSFRDLQHYHYVSTCYVAGKRTGRILETELE